MPPAPPRGKRPDEEVHASFVEHLAAAENTATLLGQYGLDMEPTSDDLEVAAAVTAAYAKDPMTLARKSTPQKLGALPPPALREANRILTTFGHSVVKDAIQIRHVVTNKLLEETENPDPRVRLKALELLGKISDVGLFAEKSEVTVTHQTSDDLRNKLRERLAALVDVTPTDSPPEDGEDVEDAEILPDEPYLDVDDVDLDYEDDWAEPEDEEENEADHDGAD